MYILPIKKTEKIKMRSNHRCVICGSYSNTSLVCFIPSWTNCEKNNVENRILLCQSCIANKGYKFLEIGQMQYLPTRYINKLIRLYYPNKELLKKYVTTWGVLKTNNEIVISQTLQILKSYDLYYKQVLEGK